MKIKHIHTIILKGVKIQPEICDCFLHDYETLGVTEEQVRDHLEGQRMLIYTGDFSSHYKLRSCPWCHEKEKLVDDFFTAEHLREHNKKPIHAKIRKFQEELYSEKLRLIRSGEIDHTYFMYTNSACQLCDNMLARGPGICAMPESARNKVRSLRVLRFKAKNFPEGLLKKPNIGYIIGQQI